MKRASTVPGFEMSSWLLMTSVLTHAQPLFHSLSHCVILDSSPATLSGYLSLQLYNGHDASGGGGSRESAVDQPMTHVGAAATGRWMGGSCLSLWLIRMPQRGTLFFPLLLQRKWKEKMVLTTTTTKFEEIKSNIIFPWW